MDTPGLGNVVPTAIELAACMAGITVYDAGNTTNWGNSVNFPRFRLPKMWGRDYIDLDVSITIRLLSFRSLTFSRDSRTTQMPVLTVSTGVQMGKTNVTSTAGQWHEKHWVDLLSIYILRTRHWPADSRDR